jgi:hypothetical protein
MCLAELVKLYQEIVKEPVAFCGGLMAGILKLDVKEEPLASWLHSHE